MYTGHVSYTTSGNPNTTGNAFADALLGNFRTYPEAQLDPIGYFRYWQFEGFVSDAWRVERPAEHRSGRALHVADADDHARQQHHELRSGVYDPAQAVTVTTDGTIVAGSGQPVSTA